MDWFQWCYTRYTIGKCWKRNLSRMLGDLYAPIHKISKWLGTPRKLRLYCMTGWFIEIGTWKMMENDGKWWKMMEIPKLETTIWTCLKPPTIMISSFPLVGSSLYQFSFIRESKSKPWYPMKHPWNPNPRSPAAIRYQWFLCIIYPKELTIYPSIPYQIPRRPLAWYLSFRKAKDNPHDSDSKIPWCFSWFFPELPPKSGLNPSIQHHPSWTKQFFFFLRSFSPVANESCSHGFEPMAKMAKVSDGF